jgi:hypothetical protein
MNKELQLPDPDCASKCANAMNETCIVYCAAKGDMEHFELRRDLKLHQMGPYPDMKKKSWKARFVLTEAINELIYNHLTGKENEHKPIIRRPHTNSQAGGGVPSDQQSQDLLHASETAVTLFEVGEKRPSETIGPTEVARKSD